MGKNGSRRIIMYFVLFEKTPFLATGRLGSLAMLSPLNGVAERGHRRRFLKLLRMRDAYHRDMQWDTWKRKKVAIFKRLK